LNEKLEILKRLENKEITPEEALELIETQNYRERTKKQIKYSETDSNEPQEGNVENKAISLVLDRCKISIERSKVEDITIALMDMHTRELIGRPSWLIFEETEDEIVIREEGLSIENHFSFMNLIKHNPGILINVKVPINYSLKNVNLYTVSGDIMMIGLQARNMNLITISGKISTAMIKAQQVDVNTTSGNIVIDDVKVLKSDYKTLSGKIKIIGNHKYINAESVSGNITLMDAGNLLKVKATSVSGKVQVYLNRPEAYNLNFETVSGNIDTSGFAIVKNDFAKKSVNVGDRSTDHFAEIATVSGKILFDKHNE